MRRNIATVDSTGLGPEYRREHLGRKVEGKTIVDDVSVEVWHGEVMDLISMPGMNGTDPGM